MSHLSFSRSFTAMLSNQRNNFMSKLNPIWIEREWRRGKESSHACNFRVLYTCLNEWDNVRGSVWHARYDTTYTRYTIAGVRKWEGRKNLSLCAWGERDRNFPSGIFLPRKAAGKEISSCIFLQAADISRRLRAHVASLRDFASLDSLLFVRHGGHDETRDRQTGG